MAEIYALGRVEWKEPGATSSAGCGRCIPLSPRSGRRPRTRTLCRLQSTASRLAMKRAAIVSMAPEPFTVRRLADYMAKLDHAKVVLDAERRRDIILTEAKQLAFAQGLELVEDEGLARPKSPVSSNGPWCSMGSFDEEVSANPRRGDPRHHPQQPEMLRAARRGTRQARR